MSGSNLSISCETCEISYLHPFAFPFQRARFLLRPIHLTKEEKADLGNAHIQYDIAEICDQKWKFAFLISTEGISAFTARMIKRFSLTGGVIKPIYSVSQGAA
jgi:hypothetical protein